MSSSSFNPFEVQLPDHTSESHPLVVVPVFLRVGLIYATVAPGYRATVLHQNRGVLEIRRDLAADVARLYELGVHRLVTTMSAVDILEDGLAGLLTDLEGYGIDWSHIPFPSPRQKDVGFQDYLRGEVEVIRRDVLSGRRVAVHLKAWGAELERRMAILATMLDPELSLVEARSMTTAAVRTGQCMLPF
ncbi:hypothetical protein [Arenimonas caeni]|uniref:hypothetical protein n=1 Tax=Arenimonas caeni TaxID=2058085 RepID=UPI0013B05C4D|nr:hypothetical protein [Arenimonas caeni]